MWAAVPLKSPDAAKSRLRDRLDGASRRRLFLAMAQHTIRTLMHARGIEGVAVVTASDEVATLAKRHGAIVVRERNASGTAEAFRSAVAALSDRADRLLLISGDLPLLTADALDALIEPVGAAPLVAIAPDRHGRGTNALASAPGIIPLCFGLNSFEQHVAAARERNIEVKIVSSDALALDIDDAADFDLLLRRVRAGPRTMSDQMTDELRECVCSLDEVPAQ